MSLADVLAANGLDESKLDEVLAWARERANELIEGIDPHRDGPLLRLLEPGAPPIAAPQREPGVPDDVRSIETLEPDYLDEYEGDESSRPATADEAIPDEVEDEFSIPLDDDEDEPPVQTGDTLVNGDIEAVLNAPVQTGDTLSGEEVLALTADEDLALPENDPQAADEGLALDSLESGEFEMLDDEELELLDEEEFEDLEDAPSGVPASTDDVRGGPPPPPPSRAVPDWANEDDHSEPDLLSLAGTDGLEDGEDDEDAVSDLVSDLLAD